MRRVALCTDTSTLFPHGVATALGVRRVATPVYLGGEAFSGDVDDFYARMLSGAKATTSQPSPGDFLAAYAEAAAGGATGVLSIHLDSRVSGTVRSAELAAREAPIPVTVVDSRTASFGVGVCVSTAAELLAGGASSSDAEAAVDRLAAALRNAFVAPSGPVGRMPDAPAWSVLELVEGAVEAGDACTSIDEAVEVMATRISDHAQPVRVGVGHAASSTEWAADALAFALETLSCVSEVQRYRVGPAVGAHTGPFSFGAFWWPAE